MLRYRLRMLAVHMTSWIPVWLLRAFFKSFDLRPDLAEAAGYNLIERTFYSPVPDMQTVDLARVRARRELPGLDLNLAGAEATLARLTPASRELDALPSQKTEGAPFWFDNASFTDFDAAVLYTMLRDLKPRRYIEVGCGYSSLVSAAALQKNIQEGHHCRMTYIDPEPRLDLRDRLKFAELQLLPIQRVPLATFQELEPGDVLFIDTSHVLKLQGDVEYELVHMIPSLRVGVWIHIHDIFTPYDYPEDWLTKKERFTGNEQYALECLLSGGDRFRVELPLYCLWQEKREVLKKIFPRGQTRPQSLWMRRVA
jgi:predicted O-methyltransferase YrrM